jgi:hypothetical protein
MLSCILRSTRCSFLRRPREGGQIRLCGPGLWLVGAPVRHPHGHTVVTRRVVSPRCSRDAACHSVTSHVLQIPAVAYNPQRAPEPLPNAPLIVAASVATRFRMRSCHVDTRRKRMFLGARLANSKSKCPASETRRVTVQRHCGAICRGPSGAARQSAGQHTAHDAGRRTLVTGSLRTKYERHTSEIRVKSDEETRFTSPIRGVNDVVSGTFLLCATSRAGRGNARERYPGAHEQVLSVERPLERPLFGRHHPRHRSGYRRRPLVRTRCGPCRPDIPRQTSPRAPAIPRGPARSARG